MVPGGDGRDSGSDGVAEMKPEACENGSEEVFGGRAELKFVVWEVREGRPGL